MNYAGIVHPFAVAELLNDCPCPCGKPWRHCFEIQYKHVVRLCDGCNFKYKVAKAAGREYEFLAGLYKGVKEKDPLPEYPTYRNPFLVW